jgi:hypothetical protein
MAHTHFPKTEALLAQRNVATGEVVYGIVVRSEPERGFVIVVDDDTFTTKILHMQQA